MTQHTKLPAPCATESRICFGISWFDSEEKADRYAAHVRANGDTYNGGWLHGTPCGRDASFDRTVDGVKQFAVTRR